MKFIDLFGGIGGFRLGMEANGFECVGYYDIDKYATAVYNYNFGENHEATNVKHIRDFPDHDILCGGFPCQDFSIAGRREGIDGERGNLFYEVVRIARSKRPSYLFLENVKGLLSSNNGWDFGIIQVALDEIGYDLQWQVLNTKNFGIPQNRERVFIIGHIRGTSRPKVFPIGGDTEKIDELFGQCTNTITARYYGAQANGSYIIESKQYAQERIPEPGVKEKRPMILNSQLRPATRPTASQGGSGPLISDEYCFCVDTTPHKVIQPVQKSNELKQIGNIDQCGHNSMWGRVYDPDGVSSTLTARGGGMGATTGLYDMGDSQIRRLTPMECERLQGFPSGWTKYGKFGDEISEISDTQRYKMCGNAVTTRVIEAIAKKLVVV